MSMSDLKHNSPAQEKYLTVRDIADRYSVSIATVWRWTAERPEFPAPVKLGAACTRWKLSQVTVFEGRMEAQP